jgi:hypothetical protein
LIRCRYPPRHNQAAAISTCTDANAGTARKLRHEPAGARRRRQLNACERFTGVDRLGRAGGIRDRSVSPLIEANRSRARQAVEAVGASAFDPDRAFAEGLSCERHNHNFAPSPRCLFSTRGKSAVRRAPGPEQQSLSLPRPYSFVQMARRLRLIVAKSIEFVSAVQKALDRSASNDGIGRGEKDRLSHLVVPRPHAKR